MQMIARASDIAEALVPVVRVLSPFTPLDGLPPSAIIRSSTYG